MRIVAAFNEGDVGQFPGQALGAQGFMDEGHIELRPLDVLLDGIAVLMHQIFEMEKDVAQIFLRKIAVEFPYRKEGLLLSRAQRPAVIGGKIDRARFLARGRDGGARPRSLNDKRLAAAGDIFGAATGQPEKHAQGHHPGQARRTGTKAPEKAEKGRGKGQDGGHRRGMDNTIH